MTPRRRLSTAIRKAQAAAGEYTKTQAELHEAFEGVYGFDLAIEELGGDCWVDSIVYGSSERPSLADFDKAVRNREKQKVGD